ncbi:10788_t:CDS:1 [Funneliformis mosseae]|uniref:10788_t:CDS:1 n=1 Tax=Funneliformis mosseae TaxID=27381 RepID=A0A9N8VRU7_FUNMO|nr:10788_t:CDS:1 [Funneliformis mosseae]
MPLDESLYRCHSLLDIRRNYRCRSLLDIKRNIIVLKPNYEFLMWKFPENYDVPRNPFPFLLFRDNYLEATRSIQRDLKDDKEIAEAWKNADDKVRKEYEKLCYLNKIPHPNTTSSFITTFLYRVNYCFIYTISQPLLTALLKRKLEKEATKLYVKKLAAISNVPLQSKEIQLYIFHKFATLFKFQKKTNKQAHTFYLLICGDGYSRQFVNCSFMDQFF